MTESLEAPVDPPKPTRARLLAVVITGTYAWALTVLPPLTLAGPLSLSGLSSGVALTGLFTAPFLPRGRWAMVAALDVFVGFCLLSWWGGRQYPVEPPYAIFGSFGWLAYTFALGSLSTPTDDDEARDAGPKLDPRTPPSRLSALALLLVLAGSLMLLAAAWWVERPAASVLAHVFALSMVLILLRSGAHFATYLQVRGTKLALPPKLKPALWPLLGLFGLGGLAAAWHWLPI